MESVGTSAHAVRRCAPSRWSHSSVCRWSDRRARSRGSVAPSRIPARGSRPWRRGGYGPATITYRTTERDPGEATSPHQCLRQLVGEAEVDDPDRGCGSAPASVRSAWRGTRPSVGGWTRCHRAASPGSRRWTASVRCRGDAPLLRCAAAESHGPFGPLVDAPAAIIDEIGAPVTAGADRTIAGIRSECFLVQGDRPGTIQRVEWCYSRDGLLLFLLDEIEGVGWRRRKPPTFPGA